MTIGLYINWHGIGLLISDVAITADIHEKDVDTNAYLAKMSQYFRERGRPFVEARRKLVEVNFDLCYCWSGLVSKAAIFEVEIRAHFVSVAVTSQNLKSFLDNHPYNGDDDFSAIFVLKEGKSHRSAYLNTFEFQHTGGFPCAIIGSGRKTVRSMLEGYNFRGAYNQDEFLLLFSDLYTAILQFGYGMDEAWGIAFEIRLFKKGVRLLPSYFYTCIYQLENDPDGERSIIPIVDVGVTYKMPRVLFMIHNCLMTALPYNIDFDRLEQNVNVEVCCREAVLGFRNGPDGKIWRTVVRSKTNMMQWLTKNDTPRLVLAPEILTEQLNIWMKLVHEGKA